VYDLAAKRYAATVYLASSDRESVSEFVFALAFAPDGGALYAGMFQAATGVRVIDPTGWQVVGDVRLAPDARRTALPYTNPLGLAFSGGWLFVANRENEEVLVIDPASRSLAARLRFAGGRHAFHRVLVEGDRVYLADQDAVYELDGAGLTRRLSAWAAGQAPLEVVLAVRRE
jgi:DNA-binding beta-propeller fold protein YncE